MQYAELFEPSDDRTIPLFRGTKVSLTMVLDMLADGSTIDDITQQFPELSKETIGAGLRFGAQFIVEAHTARMKAAMSVADKIRKLKINP